MKKRLALNVEGVITYCSSTPETFGTGRCNHLTHQKDHESSEEFLNRAQSSLNAYRESRDTEVRIESTWERFKKRQGWAYDMPLEERQKILDEEDQFYYIQYKKLEYKLDLLEGNEPEEGIKELLSQEELNEDLSRDDLTRLTYLIENKENDLARRRKHFEDEDFKLSIQKLNPKNKIDRQKLLGYWESDNYKIALMASDRLERRLETPFIIRIFEKAAYRPFQDLAHHELKRIDTWFGNGSLDPKDDIPYDNFVSTLFISSKQEEEFKEKYPNIYQAEMDYHPDFVLDDRL